MERYVTDNARTEEKLKREMDCWHMKKYKVCALRESMWKRQQDYAIVHAFHIQLCAPIIRHVKST